MSPNMATDPGVNALVLARSIGDTFDALGIDWVLGGSLASSMAGEPRATMDIDVAVRMGRDHVNPLIAAVGADYFVSETMMLRAVEDSSSFNLLHSNSVLKIDVFVLGDSPLDRHQMERRQLVEVDVGGPIRLWVGSVEDQILRKLDWFRQGGETSDRQWRDVLGILKVQRTRIDHSYLRAAAIESHLEGLLARALVE
jgi:hypothetical protein